MRKQLFLLSIAFGLWLSPTIAQTFGAKVRAGLTASQIDGDIVAGYNKLGLTGGLEGLVNFNDRSFGSIGLMFTQRGAQSTFTNPSNPNLSFFALTLNYVEVPVLFHYRDWYSEESDYYRMDFMVGLSYANLMGFSVYDDLSAVRLTADLLKKHDFSGVVGVGYQFNPRWSAEFRYTRSINSMYDPRDHNPAPSQNSWLGHLLSFQAAYRL